jgi:hypothetical protein
MLICNVSARARRTVAVGIVETAKAVDQTATALSVLKMLVDEPAAALEFTDAYTGVIMVEATVAAAIVNAGVSYNLRVDEPANAVAVVSPAGGSGYTLTINETTSATDAVATVVAALVARSAMVPGVFVNSDGTSRAANVVGIMVNL